MITPESRIPVDRDWTDAELENYKLHRRFDRIGRLVGDAAMKKLMGSHVMVVGLGGVGSWAAEMLARSGVGTLTLVDFDEVCITNFNRQLHALQGAVGTQKVTAVAERLAKINPALKIVPVLKFFNRDSQEEIFAGQGDVGVPDFVIDAIDSITPKCMLLAHCQQNGIPIVTSTGSSGKLDPTRVEILDLAKTEVDPLARAVRRILREQYGFPAKGVFGIPSVFSGEAPIMPSELKYDNGKGFKCVCPQGDNTFFQCDNRNIIMGSAGFVTSAFGMAAASYVVRCLIGAETHPFKVAKQSSSRCANLLAEGGANLLAGESSSLEANLLTRS
ncbi:MAG: tRNA threonylcarbamoyladenosine dehydratase [Cryobacterium sp.]|nr:tRNA threonylcarbamoyladenosine dehydratase [Oligoflexia bacterium]